MVKSTNLGLLFFSPPVFGKMAWLSSSFSPGSFASNQLWLLSCCLSREPLLSFNLSCESKRRRFSSELAGLVCSRTRVISKTRARPTYSYTSEPWASSPPPTPGSAPAQPFASPSPRPTRGRAGGAAQAFLAFSGLFEGLHIEALKARRALTRLSDPKSRSRVNRRGDGGGFPAG